MDKRLKTESKIGIIFASPVIIGFTLFTILPLMISLVLSFTDYNIMSDGINLVGVKNYLRFFNGEDMYFFKALKATVFYTLLAVPMQLVFALGIALLLNANVKGKSIFRTIFYMPTIVPAVASSIIWMMLFDPDTGILNAVLRFFNLPASKWIFGESTAVPSLALMSLWTVGGTVIIFLASLQNVPKELYEAVDVDGGGWWHKLLVVTIPMISPTIFFNLIMGFIGSFQVFSQAFIMTQGGPNDATLFYVLYMYREAFQNGNVGVASALGWVLFLIILVMTLVVFKSSAMWVFYEGEVKNK